MFPTALLALCLILVGLPSVRSIRPHEFLTHRLQPHSQISADVELSERTSRGNAVVADEAFADSTPGRVLTDCGYVQGVQKGFSGTWVWRGIPYGNAPVGKSRWQPSVLRSEANQCWPSNWTLMADDFGPSCPQKATDPLTQSEDCLFINVWSPALPPSAPLPVMVYIHGGSLIGGSGGAKSDFNSGSDPFRIAAMDDGDANDVILVTLNYRLNVLGTLSLSELSQVDSRGVSGNYAFTDQITALRWIQTNIAAFGGDPNMVTIYGQSSGGTSVFALMCAPSAKGLFHAAISMSGSPKLDANLSYTEELNRKTYLPFSPCPNMTGDALLECLFSADAMVLADMYSDSLWGGDWLFGIAQPNDYIQPLAFVDGVTLTMSLNEALTLPLHDVPIVFGNVREEPDLVPQDNVRNFTESKWQSFLSQKFAAFENPSAVLQKIDMFYPFANFSEDVQQAYDQISADKGTICGNQYMASLASASFTSPVYSYIFAQRPSSPTCFIVPFWCPQYSFHLSDLFSLNDDLGYVYYMKSHEEHEVSQWMLKQWRDFGRNIVKKGKMSDPAWKRFRGEGEGVDSDYYVTIIQRVSDGKGGIIGPQSVANVKRDVCEWWNTDPNNFKQWWWQN